MKNNKCLNDDDYTAHLYCEIFGTPEDRDDHNPGRILDVLNTLTVRERRLLECRYRHGMTLEQTGTEIGVTKERARQIISKALRKLRHPERVRDMSVKQIEQERDRYRQRLDESDVIIQELRRQIANPPAHQSSEAVMCGEKAVSPDGLDKRIDQLEISVRLHNALVRAGYNKVRDIYDIPSITKLCGIKNLGAKSRSELFHVMRGLGFGDWIERIYREDKSL